MKAGLLLLVLVLLRWHYNKRRNFAYLVEVRIILQTTALISY